MPVRTKDSIRKIKANAAKQAKAAQLKNLTKEQREQNDRIFSAAQMIPPNTSLDTTEKRLRYLEDVVGIPGAFTAPGQTIDGERYYSVYVKITPEMAAMMLSLRYENRDIINSYVVDYRVILLSNEWHVGSDGIAFSKEGKLSNGQNRLISISTSGVAATCNVCIGVDIFEGQDMGRKRTYAENLSMTKSVDEELQNGIVTGLVGGILTHRLAPGARKSTIDIRRATANWSKELKVMSKILSRGCGSIGIKCALFAALESGKVDFQSVKDFYMEFKTPGSPDPRFHTAAQLRAWAKNNKGGGSGGSFELHYAVTQYAIKCFMSGKDIPIYTYYDVKKAVLCNEYDSYDCEFLNCNDNGDFIAARYMKAPKKR